MPVWLNTTLLGLGTVFFGLICLIFITKLLGVLVQAFAKEPAQPPVKTDAPAAHEIPDRPAFVAAVSAAIATAIGADVSGLRIHSIQKMN